MRNYNSLGITQEVMSSTSVLLTCWDKVMISPMKHHKFFKSIALIYTDFWFHIVTQQLSLGNYDQLPTLTRTYQYFLD